MAAGISCHDCIIKDANSYQIPLPIMIGFELSIFNWSNISNGIGHKLWLVAARNENCGQLELKKYHKYIQKSSYFVLETNMFTTDILMVVFNDS